MTPKLLRLALVFEFLVALVAIFTAWSEIGGQAVLDSMSWTWKFGFAMALAGSIVGFSAVITTEESLWTFRAVRWLTGLLLLIAAMACVTYYFQLQVDFGDGDESSTTTGLRLNYALCLLS